jgi:hypothetical protein
LTQTLNKTTVALGAAVGYYDGEDRTTFAAVALEADACCHAIKFLKGSETRLLMSGKGKKSNRISKIVFVPFLTYPKGGRLCPEKRST